MLAPFFLVLPCAVKVIHFVESKKEPSAQPGTPSLRSFALLGILVSAFAIIRALVPRRSVHRVSTESDSLQRPTTDPSNSDHQPVSTYIPPRMIQQPKTSKWRSLWKSVLRYTTVGLLIINVLLWLSTKKAADAAKESADLTKHVHEGVDAAIVRILRITPQYSDEFSMTLANVGKTGTPQVDGHFTVMLVSLPDEKTISANAYTDKFTRGEVMPQADNGDNGFEVAFRLPDIAAHEQRISDAKEAYRLKATLVYDNGFGRTITDTPCQQYVPVFDWQKKPSPTYYAWVECGRAPEFLSRFFFSRKNE
jgi:hypothetical protein